MQVILKGSSAAAHGLLLWHHLPQSHDGAPECARDHGPSFPEANAEGGIETVGNALVSVVIPCYNRETLVGETLDSVLAQTYENWECIVVDDGSTDSTLEVLRSYTARDPRFRVFQRPPQREKGPCACRNFGFENSRGEYIQFFDSDDLMHPRHLEMKADLLAEHPEFSFVVCQTEPFGDDVELRRCAAKNLRSKNVFEDFILGRIGFLTNAPLWRRCCFEGMAKLFDEGLRRGDEPEFYLRVMARHRTYGVLDEPLILQRIHGRSLTGQYLQNDVDLTTSFFRAVRMMFDTARAADGLSKPVSDHFGLLAFHFFRVGTRFGDEGLVSQARAFVAEIAGVGALRSFYSGAFRSYAASNRLSGGSCGVILGKLWYKGIQCCLAIRRIWLRMSAFAAPKINPPSG